VLPSAGPSERGDIFQLPLSGSLCYGGEYIATDDHLSTPSLGITSRRSSRHTRSPDWDSFQLPLSGSPCGACRFTPPAPATGFQLPLSGSQKMLHYLFNEVVMTGFQLPLSGSRGYREGREAHCLRGPDFQLPLSGSLFSRILPIDDHIIAFNSLSRDHADLKLKWLIGS
jgi:hypothetical protein